MKTTYFNRIAIIQSLAKDELHTGTRLCEDIDIRNIAQNIGLDVGLYNIKTKKELLDLLLRLTTEARELDLFPILHIEIHGSSDKKGLILSSGEFVSWQDLKISLIELNIATKNNLFILLATCYGAYLAEIILPTDRSPCWGMVGPIGQISTDLLFKSFSSFYAELLATGNGGAAVKLLNAAVTPEVIGYNFTSSEIFFEQAFKKYIAISCTNKAIKERALKIRKELKRSRLAIIPSLGNIKRSLAKTNVTFKKYKKHFFMIDLYSENKNRFTINYTKVR